MKKRIFLLIATLLISFASFSQEICLPENVVSNMIDELIVKDGMEYTLNKQDSTIKVYKRDLEGVREEISTLKLKVGTYEKIISQLEELEKITNANLKDCQREKKKGKVKSFLLGFGIGGTAATIATIVIILL